MTNFDDRKSVTCFKRQRVEVSETEGNVNNLFKNTNSFTN